MCSCVMCSQATEGTVCTPWIPAYNVCIFITKHEHPALLPLCISYESTWLHSPCYIIFDFTSRGTAFHIHTVIQVKRDGECSFIYFEQHAICTWYQVKLYYNSRNSYCTSTVHQVQCSTSMEMKSKIYKRRDSIFGRFVSDLLQY